MLDDADRMLVRLRRFKSVELAAEQLRGKEMIVPGGKPLGEHIAIHGQEDQPRLWTAGKQDVAVGALQGRAGITAESPCAMR